MYEAQEELRQTAVNFLNAAQVVVALSSKDFTYLPGTIRELIVLAVQMGPVLANMRVKKNASVTMDG